MRKVKIFSWIEQVDERNEAATMGEFSELERGREERNFDLWVSGYWEQEMVHRY
jgi:hypothetical protein